MSVALWRMIFKALLVPGVGVNIWQPCRTRSTSQDARVEGQRVCECVSVYEKERESARAQLLLCALHVGNSNSTVSSGLL